MDGVPGPDFRVGHTLTWWGLRVSSEYGTHPGPVTPGPRADLEEKHGPLYRAPAATHHSGADRGVVPDLLAGLRIAGGPDPGPGWGPAARSGGRSPAARRVQPQRPAHRAVLEVHRRAAPRGLRHA